MTLFKHINKTSLLLPHEQLYMETYHQHKQLILEKYVGEDNPTYQLIYNTFHKPLPMRPTDQYPTKNTTKPAPS